MPSSISYEVEPNLHTVFLHPVVFLLAERNLIVVLYDISDNILNFIAGLIGARIIITNLSGIPLVVKGGEKLRGIWALVGETISNSKAQVGD